MIKYLILLLSIISCKGATLKKDVENKTAIFKYINNRKSFIEYPKDPVFLKKAFDLKSFSIYDFNSYYVFVIEIGENFKNDWLLSGGWDIQLFDIYLNLGEGKHLQTLKGRKAKIDNGWDKVVVVSPLKTSDIKREINQKNSYVYDDFSMVENLTKDVILPQEKFIKENFIYVKVSKESLGSSNLKGFQVFVMGLDPQGKESSVREVKQFSTQLEFGGGSSLKENSNVVDILGDINQLKTYHSEGARISFANIKLIPFNLEKINENN